MDIPPKRARVKLLPSPTFLNSSFLYLSLKNGLCGPSGLISSNNFEDFYNEEIAIRKKLYYPPYSFIALIKVGGKDFNNTIKEANKIGDYLRSNIDKEIVLGPSVASLSKINNIYYFEIIIKYRDKGNIIKLLNEVKLLTVNNSKIKVEFDLNPNSF